MIPYNTKQREVTNYYVAQILCVRSGGSPFWSPSQLAWPPDHGPDHKPVLDPISSNQAIGTATRPWIITPTA